MLAMKKFQSYTVYAPDGSTSSGNYDYLVVAMHALVSSDVAILASGPTCAVVQDNFTGTVYAVVIGGLV